MVSRSLLKRPIIKLIRQNTAGPLFSQKQDPRVEAQVPNVNPRSSRSSKNRKPEVQELDRSPVKGEVKRKKGASLIPLTTKSGVVGQDSAGLPKSPDTLSTPKGKPQKRRRYQCQICHRYLSGKGGLRRHNMIHTGERPFKCSMCDRSFRRQHHQLNHELSCHWDEPSGSIAGHSTGGSVSCSTSGSSQGNEERLLKCKVCPAVFSSVRSLRVHLTIHDPSRPFPCTICGMKCKTSGNMRQHMRTHTATPNLCCPYCDKRFHLTVFFEEHLQHHKHWDAESTEEHVCKYCPKNFLSSSELSRHMPVHTSPETECSKAHSYSKAHSGVERGEPLGRKGKEMSRGWGVPLIRGKLPEEKGMRKMSVSESGSPTDHFELDLELDSDSDCELIAGVASADTATEGEEVDESNGTAGGRTKAREKQLCGKSDKKASDGGDTMRPDDESEQVEEGEKDKELIAHFKNPVRRSGPHYLSRRYEYNRKRGRDPKYKCEWCGRMYLSRDSLKHHLEVHKQVPHPCKCCGKVFMTQLYLRRHLRSSGM